MIGERIKILRKNKGLTQKELSEKVGVTEQAVSKWERGKSYPSIDVIQSITRILDCSPNDIFAYTDGERNLSSTAILGLTDKVEAGITPDIIMLEIGVSLVELFTDESRKTFNALQGLRVTMSQKYGIIVPMIRIRDITELAPHDYRICIGSKEIDRNTVYPSMMWGRSIDAVEGDIKGIEPISGWSIVWTNRIQEGLTSTTQTIVGHLEHVILNHFDKIISLQYVSDVIDIIAKKNSIIKSYVVPDRVSYQLLKKVLSKLVVEKNCCINGLVQIIEAIDDFNDEGLEFSEIVALLSDNLRKFDLKNPYGQDVY